MNRRGFFQRTFGALIASQLPGTKFLLRTPQLTPIDFVPSGSVQTGELMPGLIARGPVAFTMNWLPMTTILESLQPLPVGTFVTTGREGRVKLAEEGDRIFGVVRGNGGILGKNGLWQHQVTIEPYEYD